MFFFILVFYCFFLIHWHWARGIGFNRNIINNLADGIYHLGFPTDNPNRLKNEDGNNNVTFANVAYWLNKSLKGDFAKGAFE